MNNSISLITRRLYKILNWRFVCSCRGRQTRDVPFTASHNKQVMSRTHDFPPHRSANTGFYAIMWQLRHEQQALALYTYDSEGDQSLHPALKREFAAHQLETMPLEC